MGKHGEKRMNMNIQKMTHIFDANTHIPRMTHVARWSNKELKAEKLTRTALSRLLRKIRRRPTRKQVRGRAITMRSNTCCNHCDKAKNSADVP